MGCRNRPAFFQDVMAQSGPSAALRFCVPNYGDKFIGGMDCCLNATPRKEIKIAVDAHLKALVRCGDMHA
jgi:hypothetical protein